MSRKIAIIACVKDKKSVPGKAQDIYIGKAFKSWINHALHEIQVDDFYILSGKYGLLNPNTIIAPYDLNLNDQNKAYIQRWSKKLIEDLEKVSDIEKDTFYVYTNSLYAEPILKRAKNVIRPFNID